MQFNISTQSLSAVIPETESIPAKVWGAIQNMRASK